MTQANKTSAILLKATLCVGVVALVSLSMSTMKSRKIFDGVASEPSEVTAPISMIPHAPFSLDEELSFLPYGDRQCNTLRQTINAKTARFVWPPGYEEAVIDHKDALGTDHKKLEGHSGQIFEQQMVYAKLMQLPFVNTICETGFNAGHSTLMWLAAKEGTMVYSFDLGVHAYAKKMAQYLQSKYPGRLTVTWGDSTETVKEFARTHPEVRCDLIIVDGGHTTFIATEDFKGLRSMANKSNIVVYDDYPTQHANNKILGPVWESQIRRGTLAEVYACERGIRGFALGHFLFIS